MFMGISLIKDKFIEEDEYVRVCFDSFISYEPRLSCLENSSGEEFRQE